MKGWFPGAKGKKKVSKAITDPMQDVLERAQAAATRAAGEVPTYTRVRAVDRWKSALVCCTTTQFREVSGVRYVRHCGPTAVTNLLGTLRQAQGLPWDPDRDAAGVFRRSAGIGRKLLAYWNLDVLHYFGGTVDLLAGQVLRRALKECGLGDCRVLARLRPDPLRLRGDLDAGRLLYLELGHHPYYGNHHIIVSGYTLLRNQADGSPAVYLKAADGWADRPRWVRLADGHIRHWFAVEPGEPSEEPGEGRE